MEVRVPPREQTDGSPSAPRGKTWLGFAARTAALLAVLGAGWIAGLATTQEIQLARASAWVRQLASAATSKLDDWREYVLGRGHVSLAARASNPAQEAREQPATSAALQSMTEALGARIDQLRASSEGVEKQVGSRIDLLNGSVERTQRELVSKLDQLQKQIKNLEIRTAAAAANMKRGQTREAHKITPVRSQPSQSAPPRAQAQREPEAGELPRWSVWDVVDGIAILEGPDGVIAVSTGDVVPGAGRVEGIVRRSGRWVVATSKGIIVNR
jgi:hypothetical protein